MKRNTERRKNRMIRVNSGRYWSSWAWLGMPHHTELKNILRSVFYLVTLCKTSKALIFLGISSRYIDNWRIVQPDWMKDTWSQPTKSASFICYLSLMSMQINQRSWLITSRDATMMIKEVSNVIGCGHWWITRFFSNIYFFQFSE